MTTCRWCGLHETDAEHERDILEKSARVSEGFCFFCSSRLEVRDGCGYHCGLYQNADALGFTVSSCPM